MISQNNTSKSFSKRLKSLAPGKILAGKYEYLRVLGSGGMGEVHLVYDKKNDQKFAMKYCSHKSQITRFEREVLSWMRLGKHPNVVSAIYFDYLDGIPVLFIEYVEGESLKELIDQSAETKIDLELDTVLDYAIQITRGMAHLHKNGIIHRDLKPSNILIDKTKNRIKITDMGLSKVKGVGDIEVKIKTPKISEKYLPPDLTNTRDMLGTPQYMSPQQYAYSKGVEEETDIYAFGLILYELLTHGQKPFDVKNYEGWLYAHTHLEPRNIRKQVTSKFPIFKRKSKNHLFDMIMRCLAKKISDRPKSFCDIEKELMQIYKDIFAKDFQKSINDSSKLSQYALNNQAISLLEMGDTYLQEGFEKLEKLCLKYPQFLEANLNRLLFLLKNKQCSLMHFWKDAKNLPGNSKDRKKLLETMIGTSLELGCYRVQAQKLLEGFKDISRFPFLQRLQAKWMYFEGNYEDCINIFRNLSEGDNYLWEDFYHYAGSVVKLSLMYEESQIKQTKNTITLLLDRECKQKAWYILKNGEEKCGPYTKFDEAKDWSIGTEIEKVALWHEKGILFDQKQPLSTISISSDKLYALSGAKDGALKLWNIKENKEILSFEEHKEAISQAIISADGEYALSFSAGNTCILWSTKEKKYINKITAHKKALSSISIDGDVKKAITTSIDGEIKLWNMELLRSKNFWNKLKRKNITTLQSSQGKLLCSAISLDGTKLLCGSDSGKILFYDLTNPKNKVTILQAHKSPVHRIKISTDAKLAVSATTSEDDCIVIWDLNKKEKLINIKGLKSAVSSISIAANGRFILVSLQDNSIILWDLKAKSRIGVLEGHTKRIVALDTSPDGILALSASEDGTVRIWENDYIWPLIAEQKYLKIVH